MPDNRKVITQAEIDAQLSKLGQPTETNDIPEETPVDPVSTETPQEPSTQPVGTTTESKIPAPDDDPDNPPVETPPDDPYREKFANSTREAQILASKNRKITETIEQAAQLPEPTDDELRKEYEDWDDLTDFEKKMAKNALASSKKFSMIHEAVIANAQVDVWAKKVDDFLANPLTLQNPLYKELDGHEAEFRSFSMKESRRGLDFEDLVASFLYTVEKTPKAPTQKGAMLNRPNGGGPIKPQQTGYTPQQIGTLRKTDQKKYNELVAKGIIKVTI